MRNTEFLNQPDPQMSPLEWEWFCRGVDAAGGAYLPKAFKNAGDKFMIEGSNNLAMQCYSKAAEMGNEAAKRWIQPDLDLTSWEAKKMLGDIYKRNGDRERAMELYQSVAKDGDIEACFKLAGMYREQRDFFQTNQWTGFGIDAAHNAEAYEYLGDLINQNALSPFVSEPAEQNAYYTLERDKVGFMTAFDLSEKYRRQGNVYKALHWSELGIMIAKREGSLATYKYLSDKFLIEGNDEEAIKFYKLAAEKGDEFSKKWLEVERNRTSPKAKRYLGHIYNNKGDKRALEHYLDAARKGDMKAMFIVAKMYKSKGDHDLTGSQVESASRYFYEAARWNLLGMEAAAQKGQDEGERPEYVEVARSMLYEYQIAPSRAKWLQLGAVIYGEPPDERTFAGPLLEETKTWPMERVWELRDFLHRSLYDEKTMTITDDWYFTYLPKTISDFNKKTFDILAKLSPEDRIKFLKNVSSDRCMVLIWSLVQYCSPESLKWLEMIVHELQAEYKKKPTMFSSHRYEKLLAAISWYRLFFSALDVGHDDAGISLKKTEPWTMKQVMELSDFLHSFVYDNSTKTFRYASRDIYPPGISYPFGSAYPEKLISDFNKKTLDILLGLSIDDSIKFLQNVSSDRCIVLIRGLVQYCSPASTNHLESIVRKLQAECKKKPTMFSSDSYEKLLAAISWYSLFFLALDVGHDDAGISLKKTEPWTMKQVMELSDFLHSFVYDNSTKTFRYASRDIYPSGISYPLGSAYPEKLISDFNKKTLDILCGLSIDDSIKFLQNVSSDRCIVLIRGLVKYYSPASTERLERIVHKLQAEYKKKLTMFSSDPYGELIKELFLPPDDEVVAGPKRCRNKIN